MSKAFRCSRTGLLFPPDYMEEWGKKYGIGLGPVPISEALVNDYHRDPVGSTDTGMHGLSVCRSQVDLVDVSEEELITNSAILDIDDIGYRHRGPLMRAKQLKKSALMRDRYPSSIAAAEKLLSNIESDKVQRLADLNKKP